MKPLSNTETRCEKTIDVDHDRIIARIGGKVLPAFGHLADLRGWNIPNSIPEGFVKACQTLHYPVKHFRPIGFIEHIFDRPVMSNPRLLGGLDPLKFAQLLFDFFFLRKQMIKMLMGIGVTQKEVDADPPFLRYEISVEIKTGSTDRNRIPLLRTRRPAARAITQTIQSSAQFVPESKLRLPQIRESRPVSCPAFAMNRL